MNKDCNKNWIYHLIFLCLIILFIIEKSLSYSLSCGILLVILFFILVFFVGKYKDTTLNMINRISKSAGKFNKLLKVFICLLFAIAIYLVLYRAINILLYPFQFDFSEGFLLNEANLLSKGKNIYNDINLSPYYIGNYTFIYQFIYGIFLKVFGKPNFFIGRLITILSTLGICFLIFKIVLGNEKKKLFIPVFSTVSFFTTWYVYENMPYVTIGVLSIFWGLLGLYWVDRYKDSKAVYWAVLFFSLALYTKQSWIATTFAGLIYLFFYNKKVFIRFLLYLVLASGFIFVVVNVLTGWEFYKHIFAYTVQSPFSIKRAVEWYMDFINHYFVLSFFGAYYVVDNFLKKKISPYIIYLLFSIPIAFAIGRQGAYVNYFWDMTIAFSIAAGFSMKVIFSEVNRNKTVMFFVYLIILLQFSSLVYFKQDRNNFFNSKFRMAYSSGMPEREKIPACKKLLNLFKNTKGRIITDSEYGLVALADKQVEYHFFLNNLGFWKNKNLLNDLKKGRYELAVFKRKLSDSSSDSFYGVVKNNFKLYKKINGYYIYKFRGFF